MSLGSLECFSWVCLQDGTGVFPLASLFMTQKENDDFMECCDDQVCPSEVIRVIVAERGEYGDLVNRHRS